MNQLIKPPKENTSKIVDKLKQIRELGQPFVNVCSNLCGICNKRVHSNQKFLTCKQCNHRIHITCNDISSKEYPTYCAAPYVTNWICLSCTIVNAAVIFPFTLETDESLLALNSINLPSLTYLMPSYEITSELINLPNLSDYDIDENLIGHINSQYCAIDELGTLEASDKDFSLLHMNIRSLPLHHDELLGLLSNIDIDFKVIGLSEIKIPKDVSIRFNIDIPGYKFHHTSSNSASGGVGIYVKSNLTVNKRDDLSFCDNEFETIWIEIDNPKAKNILSCCAYRHPNTDTTKFSDHLQEKLSKIDNENKLICVMGDFNINLIDYANHTPTNDFINMMFSQHLQPSVLHPTRITETTSTLIDNIFVNNVIGSNIQSGNVLSQISDHLPQFCIITDFTCDYKNLSHSSYDYSHLDVNKFLADYADMDFSFSTDKSISLNDKFDNFLFNLYNLVNKHCPQKRLNKKRLKLRSKPWINNRILKVMRTRDRLFQQFKSSNSETDLRAFKLFRNRVVNELKESKKKLLSSLF